MSTSTSAFMMWPNIHIFVGKCFQITAHTCTFTACFATGLYCCSLLIFTLTVLVYLTSCTQLSLHHMISSCPLLQCISSQTPFSSPCSEIIGPVFVLTTTQWSFWCRNRWKVCTDIVLSKFLVIKQCDGLCYHWRPSRSAVICQSSTLRPAVDPTANSLSCGHNVFYR